MGVLGPMPQTAWFPEHCRCPHLYFFKYKFLRRKKNIWLKWSHLFVKLFIHPSWERYESLCFCLVCGSFQSTCQHHVFIELFKFLNQGKSAFLGTMLVLWKWFLFSYRIIFSYWSLTLLSLYPGKQCLYIFYNI